MHRSSQLLRLLLLVTPSVWLGRNLGGPHGRFSTVPLYPPVGCLLNKPLLQFILTNLNAIDNELKLSTICMLSYFPNFLKAGR